VTVIKTHDFHRTESLDRQYVPAFNAALDAFARRGSVELSGSLHRATQLSASPLRESSWREVTDAFGESPYLATFNLEPLSGTAILSLPYETVLRILEYRLGGGSQVAFSGHGELTGTDFAILATVVSPLLREIAESLSPMRAVSACLVSQESSTQYVQLAGPSEMFLVSALQLCIGEDEPGVMTVALPFPLLRQITEAMRSGPRAHDSASLVDQAVVTQASLEVWLEFPPVRLPSTEVSELKPGDVIRFFHPLRQPLDLRAEGVLVARAAQGAVGSKVVCSILEEVCDDDG
jgi:flagellar motor switch protein FliM